MKHLDPSVPTVVLRHDLDFAECIPSALRMGRIENHYGAKATYFVRLHAKAYNPAEYRTYLTLRRLVEWGHEIGFHFECCEFSDVTGESEADVFIKGKRILETLLNLNIVSACEHGDYGRFSSEDFVPFFRSHRSQDFGIEYDPYDPLYCKDIKYISDSNQNWREGCMCRHVGTYKHIQILTHPGFWFKRHYVLE